MTVLVTGAGLIGRLTATALHAQGEAVVLADVRVPQEATDLTVPIVRCDVTDFERLSDVVQGHGVTSIVHTAALLSSAIRPAGECHPMDEVLRQQRGSVVGLLKLTALVDPADAIDEFAR